MSNIRQKTKNASQDKSREECVVNYTDVFNGAMSRYFESFCATCKITFKMNETTKYKFCKIEKHQNGKNKPKRNEDG